MTLGETYDRILCNIDPLFEREALRILQWLTFSRKPLSLEEIAEIVAFDVDSDTKFSDKNRLAEPEEVLDICSSLVISVDTDVDENKEGNKGNNITATSASKTKVPMVRLAHFTVKEYLVSHQIRKGSTAFFSLDEKVSNAVIGEICLSCLLLYNEASFHDSKEFSDEYPLAKYSAEFWHHHLAESRDAHLPPHRLAIELFLSEEKMRNWIALYDLDSDSSRNKKQAPESPGSPLYYAVLTRLGTLVETLIELHKKAEGPNGNKPELQDTDDSSATLQKMSKGAYVNAAGGKLYTPLQAASWFGLIDTVGLLIKHGADPNVYGGCEGGSALSAAARNGHLEIMKLLLDTGADLNEGILSEDSDCSKGSNVGNSRAKNHAVQEDEAIDEYVEELNTVSERMKKLAQRKNIYKDKIKRPVDTPHRRALKNGRRTALFEAAFVGDAAIVNFMLNRGALINARNGERGETALIGASWQGHDEVVQILLEKGALVDKADFQGYTALMVACMNQKENIARMLVEKGSHL